MRTSRMSPKVMMPTAVALGAVLLALVCAAQTLSPGEVRIVSRAYTPGQKSIRVESNAVQVGVVVRDQSGHAVAGLNQSDFEISDRGGKESISSFLEVDASVPANTSTEPSATATPSPASARPPYRFIGLFLDDLDTEPGDFRRTQLAAEKFVRQSLAVDDKVGIFANSGEQSAYFSADKTALVAEIEKMHGHPRVPESGLHSCSHISPYEAYLIINNLDPDTLNIAAADEAECGGGSPDELKELVRAEAEETWDLSEQVSRDTFTRLDGVISALARMPGHRTLVIASPGFLTPTLQESQDFLVTQALRANVVIDSLDAMGLAVEPMTPSPGRSLFAREAASNVRAMYEARMAAERQFARQAVLRDLSDSTGGSFFHNNNDLVQGFVRLAAAPESAYLISFSPDPSTWDGKYHKLKVALSGHEHLKVQARPGYFAPARKSANQQTLAAKIDAEMKTLDLKSDFLVNIREGYRASNSGGRQIILDTHVDIQKLPFEKVKDRQVEKLTFVAGLFDPQGKFITGKEAEMDLALKQENFERFSKSGITGAMSLEAPPGNYRLRVVVEEAVKGEMSATIQKIQIP